MAQIIRAVYMLKSVWAIIAALLVGSLLILSSGHNPIDAYYALFEGAFFEYYGIASTLVKMSPLILVGLAVTVPLRAGQFNIGAEGQIYMGALFATWAALYLPAMPGWLHISICSLTGALGGALWALIPAYLKAYHRINEIIITLLMNYVAINIVSYFVSGPMMAEDAPYPYSDEIPEALNLPHIMERTDAHVGVIVGLGMAVVLYFVFQRTTLGFSFATVGRNPLAARYAGISVKRNIIGAFLIGGALAGLAGTFEVLGLKYRLFHLFSPGYGFDGVVITFLSGANPLFVVLAATFLGGLRAGAGVMQRAVGVDTTAVEAIQGLVVIFVATGLAFHYRNSIWARILARRKEYEAVLGDGAEPER